jgi:hypothetical protein
MRASFRGVDQCWSAVEPRRTSAHLKPGGSAASSSRYTRELPTDALSRPPRRLPPALAPALGYIEIAWRRKKMIVRNKSARGAVKLAVIDRRAAAKLVREKLQKHIATLGRQRLRQRDDLADLLVGQAKDVRHRNSLAQWITPRDKSSVSMGRGLSLEPLGGHSEGLPFCAFLLELHQPLLNQRGGDIRPNQRGRFCDENCVADSRRHASRPQVDIKQNFFSAPRPSAPHPKIDRPRPRLPSSAFAVTQHDDVVRRQRGNRGSPSLGGQHFASVLQDGRGNANIDAGWDSFGESQFTHAIRP